jgi:hypothetical protein
VIFEIVKAMPIEFLPIERSRSGSQINRTGAYVNTRALLHPYVFLPFFFPSVLSGQLQSSQNVLPHHVPAAVAKSQAKPLGALPATKGMNLTIVLPLRNQTQLSSLLSRLYDPSSPNYLLTVTADASFFHHPVRHLRY